ncbi:hypothetical protein NC652_007979 [Populus alba x Populus x berolinensis]|nr:hypothetical protein NC652_007979 [Populus alba x Populus x berolinensis]
MHHPTQTHWTTTKRLLRYLKNTIFHGVTISKTSSTTLTCFSDADWAGSLDVRKSTSAYLLFLGNTPISWSSIKQRTIARSSTEAKYRALAMDAAESHSRMKHIQIDIHFVRDLVAKNILIVKHVNTTDQLADLLTKPLSRQQTNFLRDKIGLFDEISVARVRRNAAIAHHPPFMKTHTLLESRVQSPRLRQSSPLYSWRDEDTSNISKTADKVFEMLDAIVERIGEENMLQVVTDNAANYKAAGQLLMGKRKRLFWTPCAAHCIDLILEDFEKKLEVHQVTIANGRRITSYIYSRTILISMLRHFTKGKDLIRPAAIRFATTYLTLGCLSDCKI